MVADKNFIEDIEKQDANNSSDFQMSKYLELLAILNVCKATKTSKI